MKNGVTVKIGYHDFYQKSHQLKPLYYLSQYFVLGYQDITPHFDYF